MEPIGRILGRSALTGGDHQERFATAVIGAVNEALHRVGRMTREQARAISFRHGQTVIRVSHSAIAGLIRIHQTAILQAANENVKNIFPNQKEVVTALVCRVS